MKKKHIKTHIVPGVVLAIVIVGVFFIVQKNQIRVGVLTDIQMQPVDPEDAILEPINSKITYRNITVTTSKPGAEISKEVGLSNVPLVLAFNRLDVGHIQTNATIVIPSDLTDWNALSPFPMNLDVVKDIDKILLVSQRVQAFAAYENGKLVHWGTVSTGKKDTQTPSKLYFTNWKGKSVVSTLEGGYILPWAFNLDSLGGIALHEFDLPGYPASHACVRMSGGDAEWIYNWAKQWVLAPDGQTQLASGTPVIIFGEYAYGKTAPWKKLAVDPTATTLSQQELTEIVNKNIETINNEAVKRELIEKTNTSE